MAQANPAVGGPSLGDYGDSATPPDDRQARRASRHALKAAQRKLTKSKSSSLCWYPLGAGDVSIEVGRLGIAHVPSLARCGSPHICPVCTPVVRQNYAKDIDQGLAALFARGGSALMVTLTCRHQLRDELAARLDLMATAVHTVTAGRPWQRRRDALGFMGAIRAVEITRGPNGWHPHVHALFCFDRALTFSEESDFRQWIHGRWSAVVERRGFGTITREHGTDVRLVSSTADLGDYLTKVEGGWTAGLELARTDRKRLTPFELLVDLVATGEKTKYVLWQEYEQATFGKRAVRWSPGLRGALLGTEVEASDEELAASEGADVALLRRLYERAEWVRQVRRGTVGDVLTETERWALEVIAAADLAGIELPPLEAP